MQTFLHSNNVNIAAIQEAKLINKPMPPITPELADVRLDRQKNIGGGLQMLYKETNHSVDISASLPQSADPHLEQPGISITMPNRQIQHIHNIYIPPCSSRSAGHIASIAHLICNNEMSLIVVDLNAHFSRLDTNTNEDDRGEQLAVYTILSLNEATRLSTNGRSTASDISLASNDIALLSDMSVSTSLASDQSPILITIKTELSTIDEPRRIYINFKKADWARYAVFCDKYLAETGEKRTVEQAEKTFWKAVNKATGLFIPAVRIQHFQPTLPASSKSLADERYRKRGLNPADKTLNDLNKQIQKLVVEDKRTKWQSAVDKCDHRTGISHPWRLVNGLSGKQPHNSPNKGVRFVD